MGKYIRHLIAALIGALVAILAKYIGAHMGIQFEDTQIRDLTDAIVDTMMPLVLVWWYAWSEKFLRRYPWLDAEGYTARKITKEGM